MPVRKTKVDSIMSDALVWEILQKNNGKAIKRTHPVVHMTMEKGSLTNLRSRSDSGFAKSSAVDVTSNDDGIPVLAMRNQKPDSSRKPDKMWRTVTLNGGVRKAISKADNLLKGYDKLTRHRALAKVSALYRAHNRKNCGVDHSSLLPTSK